MDEQEAVGDLLRQPGLSTFDHSNFEVHMLIIVVSGHHLDGSKNQAAQELKQIYKYMTIK